MPPTNTEKNEILPPTNGANPRHSFRLIELFGNGRNEIIKIDGNTRCFQSIAESQYPMPKDTDYNFGDVPVH